MSRAGLCFTDDFFIRLKARFQPNMGLACISQKRKILRKLIDCYKMSSDKLA